MAVAAARTSATNLSGCSQAPKCPPRSGSPQCTMLVKRCSARRREGRGTSRGKTVHPVANRDGVLDGIGEPAADLLDALPVEPRRRSAGAGQPIECDVVEDLVAREHAVEVTIMV